MKTAVTRMYFSDWWACRGRMVPRLFTLSLILVIAGCATWQKPGEFDNSVLRSRAVSQTVQGVTLSATVLSSEESVRMFGVNVNKENVQPVWVEIENTTNQVLWLLRQGTDPDLFSPLEVAWSFHKTFGGETNHKIDDQFDTQGFENPVAPGETRSGILFTNPHPKTRLLSVDILGQGQLFPFTLFPRVPDDASGDTGIEIKLNKLIESATDDYQTADKLRQRLEQLACCATGADGATAGDPLNVILVGKFEDIVTALVRRGYRRDRRDYDDMQYVFGRRADVVARNPVHASSPANWLRMWVAPFRYQGKAVIIVQAGRPLGWRLKKTETEDEKLALNPYVDEVRNLLIQDMFYSGGLAKLAFVTGVGATQPGETRASIDGVYQTDGRRTVLFFVTRPLSLSDVELLEWDPYLRQREAEAVKEIESLQQ